MDYFAKVISVGLSITRMISLFKAHGADGSINSEELFDLLVLLKVILKDFGVKYPPDLQSAVDSHDPVALKQALLARLDSLEIEV